MAFFGSHKYSEEELVAGCISNDRRAQEALYRCFFPEMMRMCLRHTRDEDKAIEIVNTGFLRVFRKLHTYGFKGSLEGWVRRLMYHCVADYFRENARYSHFLVFEEWDQPIPERSHDRFFEEDILTEVQKLPRMSQQVFRMYAIEGFNHSEISEALGISEGTSKWHLSNARQKLKEQLIAIGFTTRTA